MEQYIIFIIVCAVALLFVLFAAGKQIYSIGQQRKYFSKQSFPKTPPFLIRKYRVWFDSFQFCSVLQYVFLIAPIVASVVSLYFFSSSAEHGIVAMLVAFSATLLPLLNFCISPKTFADGFYKGMITLEQAMQEYELGLIDQEELIKQFKIAEKYTNPYVN
jgi:uncharacterized membrane protein